jgi:hypothetical protein
MRKIYTVSVLYCFAGAVKIAKTDPGQEGKAPDNVVQR